MNKSESKYFATAVRMDEAFLKLLGKKDFAYITVKEICEAAGVNRSTFYLHYETMADLLSESVSHMNEQFLAYMKKDSEAFVAKLRDCPLDELYLITPEYLTPYSVTLKKTSGCTALYLKTLQRCGWKIAMRVFSVMSSHRFSIATVYRSRTGRILWRFICMG